MAIKMKFIEQKSINVDHYYAENNGAIIAEIRKFKDTKTDTNPFQVSFKKDNVFSPDVCFWPNIDDCNAARLIKKGYYSHDHGGLDNAKQYIETKVSKKMI